MALNFANSVIPTGQKTKFYTHEAVITQRKQMPWGGCEKGEVRRAELGTLLQPSETAFLLRLPTHLASRLPLCSILVEDFG